MTESGERLRALSVERWGLDRAVDMIGRSPVMAEMQARLEKLSRFQEPVLVTGESGTGKELVAQAVYLLGKAKAAPYVAVNCPQFQEGNLTVSELFGHRKGSFTGAVADRKGAFEEADGGVIFLDEIGDLPKSAQAMLLRALATGEFRALGSERSRTANVRVVTATNRPLNQLMLAQEFRPDLFFRLRHFQVVVPSLRERGDDWRLIADHCLVRLARRYGVAKRFSRSAMSVLERYDWPGNVRQLVGLVNMGYAMADGELIELSDFASHMNEAREGADAMFDLYQSVVRGPDDFWTIVYKPFMDRDLNRREVRAIIRRGFDESRCNYRQLLELFRIPASDYQRFMDFLRHHDLKPTETRAVAVPALES